MQHPKPVDRTQLLETLEEHSTEGYGGVTVDELEPHLPWVQGTISKHLEELVDDDTVAIEWRFDYQRPKRGYRIATTKAEVPA